MPKLLEVIIVGGGFAGTMVAVHLLRAGVPDVVLVERTPPTGHGVAYGTPLEEHLLNVPAGEMGAFDEDPGHFARWMGVDAATFVARRHYGDYVGALLADAAADAQNFRVVAEEVIGLLPSEGGYRLRLRGGEFLEARQVVLAIGQFPPPPLRAAAGVEERAWYVDDPWSVAATAPLPPGADVLLVGTGLTAVDVALTLLDRAGAGHVAMISRHARVPVPQRAGPAHRDWLDPTTAPQRISALLRLFRLEVETTGADPRAVIDALRPHVPTLWARMPWVERRRFMRHVRSAWEALRNRLPVPTAERVAALQAAGRLEVVAARVQRLSEAPGGAIATLDTGDRHVARVINCTGPDMLYRRITHPLVLDVIGTGLGRPDPLGLGLDVGLDFRLLDEDGVPSRGLYALGAPAKGRWWETMAVAELRVHARDLAARVAALVTETS